MNRSFANACSGLLGLVILARVAVGWLPAGPWSPSGYQCGSYYLFLALGRAHSCTAEAAFGEGARAANRLDFAAFRREKFTVDEQGYRNLPGEGKPRMILFGSSFSLGLALNDEDTLSAQLSRQPGYRVYNASDVLSHSLSAEPIARAAKTIGLSKGWVLLEVLNRAPYSWMPPQPENPRRRIERQVNEAIAPLHSIERRLKNPYVITRISVMLNMRLENDVVLPNPDSYLFPEEVLSNGRHILLYSDDKSFFKKPADPGPSAAAVVHLQEDLARDGLKLAVMLLPTGYSVYYPLLRDQAGADTGGAYMASLQDQLNNAGVPVYNCLPLLRAAAARELRQGRLIYWPDDAHWNPRGVETVADALTPWLRSLTDAVQ